MLYFANSGATVTDKVADGDTLGIFQSRSDQPLGADAKTGGRWGYVADAFSNPKANTNSTTGKYDSILYDAPPAGSVLDQRAVKYDFDLPNGSYDVTFGFRLPSGWGGRTMDLMAEGATVGTAAASNTALERTFRVQVTDGTLNLQVHSQAGRTNTFHDPALNFVLVRQPLDYSTGLLAEKIRQASLSPDQASLYAADSVDALKQELAAAQSLVDAASTDAVAIKAAYEATDAATSGLRKLVSYDSFRPGQPWLDNNAKPIQAHGGQVLPTKDADGRTIYYWYGEDRTNGYQPMPGVHAYSSYDLYNWKDEGLALKALTARAQLDTDPYFTARHRLGCESGPLRHGAGPHRPLDAAREPGHRTERQHHVLLTEHRRHPGGRRGGQVHLHGRPLDAVGPWWCRTGRFIWPIRAGRTVLTTPSCGTLCPPWARCPIR